MRYVIGLRQWGVVGGVVLALAGVAGGASAAPGSAGLGSGVSMRGGLRGLAASEPVLDRTRHGRDALARLEAAGKVEEVAARAGWSSDQLRGVLGSDESLHVSPDGGLSWWDAVSADAAGASADSTQGEPAAAASAAFTEAELAATFTLESLPGADRVIYLDFVGFNDNVFWYTYPNGIPTLNTRAVTYGAFDLDGSQPCAAGTADPACFTAAELTMIRETWARVAEAYAAFEVNVTTRDPGRDAIRNSGWDCGFFVCPLEPQYGAHVVITGSDVYCGSDGVATAPTTNAGCAVGAFYEATSKREVLAYVTPPGLLVAGVPITPRNLAYTAVHEVGHLLDLTHAPERPYLQSGYDYGDLKNGCSNYGYGVWGAWMYKTICGDADAPINQFTPFEQIFVGSWYVQDVYAEMEELVIDPDTETRVIGGIAARADEPSPVEVPGDDFVASGRIGPSRSSLVRRYQEWDLSRRRPADQDSYRFTVPAGAVGTTIGVVPAVYSSLDVKATLYDGTMTPVAVSDPPAVRVDSNTATGVDASISAVLAPGVYTLVVEGAAGLLTGSYSDAFTDGGDTYGPNYGSIGTYTVTINTVPEPAQSLMLGAGALLLALKGRGRRGARGSGEPD